MRLDLMRSVFGRGFITRKFEEADMVDVKAREKQLRERLAELEGRLHRIERAMLRSGDLSRARAGEKRYLRRLRAQNFHR